MDENNGNGNDNQANDQQSPNGDNQVSAPQSASGGSEQQGSATGQSGEKKWWPEPVRWDYPGPVYCDGQNWRLEDKDAVIQMQKERREEHERKTRENWLQTHQGKLCRAAGVMQEFPFQQADAVLRRNRAAALGDDGVHRIFDR